MLLRDTLATPRLRLTLLVGDGDLERPVSRVFVTDLPDPRRYLAGGEIVLTGLMWRREPADSEAFVAACAAAEVTAIGAGDAAFGSVPEDLVEACRRHRMPLFEVPVEISFRDVIDEVTPSLWAHRSTGLATVLGRHRGLVAAMAAGARLVDLIQPVAADLGVDCWVLTPTGRLVVGTAALRAGALGELATAFVSAGRLPARVTVDGRRLDVVGVPGRPAHRLASWLLAYAAREAPPDAPDRGTPPEAGDRAAPPVPPDVAAELTSLVAMERVQVDEAVRIERRLADQVGAALAGRGGPGDLGGRLRACGLKPDAMFLAAAVSFTSLSTPPELAVAVCDEIVRPAGEPTVVTGHAIPEAVLAVLAVPPERVAGVLDTIRAAVAVLGPGIGAGRLAVGVSALVNGAEALTGAVAEARHALRTAIARPEPATVVYAGELTSHLLLLAGVPADTRRSFRDRLLGPLVEYDRAHHADLLRTLSVFLASSGSWSRCAALLHVHVNTLRYRIGRIEQLTGRDLTRFEDRVDFFLALRLPSDGDLPFGR